ncbi:alpha/beta hydrolase family protein [Chitinophaga lutea]
MQATAQQSDPIADDLRRRAATAFADHPLPLQAGEWQNKRAQLYSEVMRRSGALAGQQLPPDFRETRRIPMAGFTIRSGYFQTRPGTYATVSLYVPEGNGPFPGVVVMHGHWPAARNSDIFQAVSQQLARNGYVALCIDAWGTGERTTTHGEHEYHGSCLGASLMNVGQTLMGMQITDNIRAVDLLCSLPYVDANRIGATGASGGGNQTMWLAALDERVKAAAPVVSVGTFESYVLNSNCVCELLPGGLTFTEESGILALTAPRALKLMNAERDANKAFTPAQMQRSFDAAKGVYNALGVPEKLSYELFDTTHGYWPPMQSAMLGFFAKELKGQGDGSALPLAKVELLPEERLRAFPAGRRDTLVTSTAAFLAHAKTTPLKTRTAGSLKTLLGCDSIVLLMTNSARKFSGWDSVTILTRERGPKIILHTRAPQGGKKTWRILPGVMPDEAPDTDEGLICYAPYGTGARRSPLADTIDGKLPRFHTLSRSLLWLGKTVQGVWVQELETIQEWLELEKSASTATINASREMALAALLHGAAYGRSNTLELREVPLSWRLDDRAGADFFNMAVHIPNILSWGDVSDVTAACRGDVVIADPRRLSGKLIAGQPLEEWKQTVLKQKKSGRLVLRTVAAPMTARVSQAR